MLEVLPPEDLAAPVRVRRHRRWWWVVPVVGVVALAVAFPVRAAVGRAELRGLEARWRVSQQVITGGFAQITTLRSAAGVSVVPEIPAVFSEQADDVERELNATRAEWVLDPALRSLRSRIAQALAREVTDLRRDTRSPGPPYLTPQSFGAQAGVERALASQLQRLSLSPAPARRVPPLLAAAEGLARLGRIADQPIGARLIVSSSNGLSRVDIDGNRIEPLVLPGVPPPQVLQLLPRAGLVVIRAVGQFGPDSTVDEGYAAPATLGGPVADLGAIDALVPGEVPDTFWVRRPDGTAVELDGSLRVVRGPVGLPYSSFPVGGTARGLVIAIRAPSGQSFSLEIIDPARPAGPATVVGSGVPLTTCGNRLIWFENGEQAVLHITDVIDAVDHTVEPGPGMWPDGVWACSPDNSRVAGAWFKLTDRPVDVPGVVDLGTGRVLLTTGGGLDTQPGTTSTVWTYAGDRVFFAGTLSNAGRQDPMTFRPGDPAVMHLRLPGSHLAMVPLP